MIDLNQFPIEMHDKVKEDIEKHGEWVVSSYIYMAPLWKMIYELKESDPDISWMITVMHLINFFGTKDPLPMHYIVARETLELKKISEDKGVDTLARELVIACQQFKQFMEKECMGEWSSRFPLHNEKEYLVPKSEPWNTFIWERDGCNTIDFLFASFLENHFSNTGKRAAKALKGDSRKRFQNFIDSGFDKSHRQTIWDNWINKRKENTTIVSPHLSILADVVWEDCCAPIWKKEGKNVPALTQGVHPSVAKILSHRTQTKDIENTIYLIHETQIIAKLPTVDQNLIKMVTKGIGKLNSIYHHKLIRFECKSGFENWTSGKADSRVLRFDRGCSEIAECLGLQSNQAIETIKALLHAQAHLRFSFEDGSCGNLIILNKFRSSTSGREEGIMVTLGPQLLPHYTFQTSKRNRLLIPVPELPPLVGSSNSHASQAALQMLLMQLFADKSVELSEIGSISISKEEWKEMIKESGLSHSMFNQTLDRWLNDGDDGPRVLILEGVDRYSLGPAYSKEQKFLIDQGLLRKKRKKGGEKSVSLKRK